MKPARNVIALAGAAILISAVVGWYFFPRADAGIEKGRYQKTLACDKIGEDAVFTYENMRDGSPQNKEYEAWGEQTIADPKTSPEDRMTNAALLYAIREAKSSKDARATAWAMCMDFHDEK